MRFRGKSIRRKIGALVLVPLLSLVSVWAFASAITVPGAREVFAETSASDALSDPARQVLQAVQRERRQTLVRLGDPRLTDEHSGTRDSHRRTDEAVELIRDRADGSRGGLDEEARDQLDAFLGALDGLEQLRDQVRTGTLTTVTALDAYSDLADPGFRLLAVLEPVPEPGLDRHARAVNGLALAREQLSQEDAMVAGALAAGRLSREETERLTALIEARDRAYDGLLPELPQTDRRAHESFWESGPGRILSDLETVLLSDTSTSITSLLTRQWNEAGSQALDRLAALDAEALERYRAERGPGDRSVIVRAVLIAGLGLAAVCVSVVIAWRNGRGLARDLRTLSQEAKEAAEVRVPGVMLRLAAGEPVDVDTEAPLLEYPPDEVGQVGRALNSLQREAVRAAVERSETRRGVSEVFVNLARRNQVLLHRQINLLELLEQRADKDEDLADLQRLNHLTTRMRRHAEGLVILSGAAPARQWRKPELLMDVVRAAVDEVEDFERIEIRRLPPLAVAGGAVADLIHLVAELLENATVFSPPHTAVQVSGERVPHGFTLEIHDRGLGMTADALRDINERLAGTPEFQLSDTDRIGLFVVSRLAERHGIRVSLRESPYRGTTAVAVIPGDLLSDAPQKPAERPLAQTPSRPALPNRRGDGPVELEAPVATADRAPDAAGHAAAREPAPPAGAPPLPQRRRAPVLVADHGRTVGRAPAPDDPPPAEPAPEPAPAAPGTTGSGLPRRLRQPSPAPGVPRAAGPAGAVGGG
ncbi:nitrate- and nitrite sensing domain-containing protein, partial [Streptomyces sp. DSM 44917]